jgi:Fe-Mn family superoxide dismutase
VAAEPPFTVISTKAEIYSLPALTFGYGDLEPFIDEPTLMAHHQGHHEAYRKKMNTALSEWRQSVNIELN